GDEEQAARVVPARVLLEPANQGDQLLRRNISRTTVADRGGGSAASSGGASRFVTGHRAGPEVLLGDEEQAARVVPARVLLEPANQGDHLLRRNISRTSIRGPTDAITSAGAVTGHRAGPEVLLGDEEQAARVVPARVLLEPANQGDHLLRRNISRTRIQGTPVAITYAG